MTLPRLVPALLALLLGCGSAPAASTPDAAAIADVHGQDAAADAGQDTQTPHEPALTCPNLGSSPVTLPSSGWQQPANAQAAKDLARNKAQAQDILAAPQGPWFVGDMADDATPLQGAWSLHGILARSPADAGLDTTPLPGEWVTVARGQADGTWSVLGRAQSGSNGEYAIALPAPFGPGLHAAYAILEAAPSCTVHYALTRPAGTPVVVTDIDGTLTSADKEFLTALVVPDYDAKEMKGGHQMLQAWAQKGYAIVYLSARGHIGRAETRAWLDLHGYPQGVLITGETFANGEGARSYKRAWLQRMGKTLGWTFPAAYGNADSDVHAYADAGIDKAHTFIIGPLADKEGAVAIPDEDYTAHTATFVAAQPQAPN